MNTEFQISGTILTGQIAKENIQMLSNALNMTFKATKDGFLMTSKGAQLLIEPPLIQGKFKNLEAVEQKIKDSLNNTDCLYNIEVYEQNGRPIDRWQG